MLQRAVSARDFRVAICGAGATGMTVIQALNDIWKKRQPVDNKLHIDLFEAALTPLGLLRTGVAPDSTSIKQLGDSLISRLTKLSQPSESVKTGFSFDYFGGVEIGKWTSLQALREAYDLVLMTTGPPVDAKASSAPPLRTPGEHLNGVISAPEMVNLYNGDALACSQSLYDLYTRIPGILAEAGQWTMDSHLLDFSLARSSSVTSEPPRRFSRTKVSKCGNLFRDLEAGRAKIVIIGQGNVALDVARVLSTAPTKLPKKHVAVRALALLKKFDDIPRKHFILVGRRGPFQATWSLTNLREMFHIGDDVKVLVRPEELAMSLEHPRIAQAIAKERSFQKMAALLEEAASNYKDLRELNKSQSKSERSNMKKRTVIEIRNFLTPAKFHSTRGDDMDCVHFRRNKFERKNEEEAVDNVKNFTVQPDEATQEEVLKNVSLVVKSLGYGSVGVSKYAQKWLGFDNEPYRLKSAEIQAMKKQNLKALINEMSSKACTEHKMYAAENSSAPVYVAGWLRTLGQGTLFDSTHDARVVSEQIIASLDNMPPEIRSKKSSFLADLLCLKLATPEIGIPLDWEEAMSLIEREKDENEKLTEWKKAVDIINVARKSQGPRSSTWTERISKLKPACLHF